MFFAKFNPMTAREVDEKVAAKPGARAQGELSGCLEGRSIEVKLTGEFAPERLAYRFDKASVMHLAVNGEEYDNVPYAAVKIGDIVLFTHLVPGTSRGWHVVFDERTELITAFETWFGISVPVGGDLFGTRKPTHYRDIPREVQRHYHFGYAVWGGSRYENAPPEKLHTTTNRLEGRGMRWIYDDGREALTFFPSVVCSTNVLLDSPRDTVTVTYPSDYLRIDDEYYIYAKWGVEFGGEMHLEVINLFDKEAVGMILGFGPSENTGSNEPDRFIYELHSARLEITGDAAHLEKITMYGDKTPPMADMVGYGARYAYRPKDMDPPMTRQEALEAAKTRHIFEFDGPNIMMSGNTLPFCYDLVGKEFSLSYDQVRTPYAWSEANIPANLIKKYEYNVSGKDTLKWRVPGGQWHEEKYVCFEPARDIYFFSHMLTDDPNIANVTHAIDFSTGLSTCVYAKVGSWTSDWEIGATCLFGTAAGAGIAPAPFSKRHDFTTELVGKSVAWAYSDSMCSIHVYSSPESYSWTIFQDDNSGGATWSSPCFYIKLRDDAYLFQWVEENCNGSQGLVCFNPEISHDGGFFFGLSHHMGLSLNITGAYSRLLGQFDIMKHFK
jgi:hypothetical protein